MITLSAPSLHSPDRSSVFRDGKYIGMISLIGGSYWSFEAGSNDDVKHSCKEFAISHLARTAP